MNQPKNSVKRYILFSIFITCSIILIKKANIFGKMKEEINLRDLDIIKTLDYSCDKAGSRLMDKYEEDFIEKETKYKGKLNAAQQSIIDFARDQSYKNIKPYFKRVGIYITFLCIAVIFIFLWISYLPCYLYKYFLFSQVEEPSKYPLIFYLISVIFNFLVIIFSIVVLCLTNPFYGRINGLFCSTLTMLDHFTNGLESHYPLHTAEWNGLNHVKDRFHEANDQFDAIKINNINEAYDEAIEQCKKEESNCICDISEVKELKEIFEIYYDFNYVFFILLPNHILDILGAKSIIDETRIDAGDDIYNFLHNNGNRHIKNANIANFVLTLIIGVSGIVFLSLYYFLKKDIYRIIYIVIWNISMLFAIFVILFSVIFGVVGYICNDGIQIVNYIFSVENLKSDNPVLFTQKNEFLSILIDECANQEGIFLYTLGEDILSAQDSLDEEFQEEFDGLNKNTCNNVTRDALIKYYQSVYVGLADIINIIGNLYKIKCRFAKNDKYIILNELHSAGKRAITLSTFQFLIGIFLAISVLGGICLVHKYKYKNNKNLDDREVIIHHPIT